MIPAENSPVVSHLSTPTSAPLLESEFVTREEKAQRSQTDGVKALPENAGLGLDKTKVQVVDHDQRWSAHFEQLRATISVALSRIGAEIEIEHIGSTSVTALVAKPVLDVAVGLAGEIDVAELVGALSAAGLGYQGDLGDYGGHLFTIEPEVGYALANVHVVLQDNFQWRWYRLFRDALRSDASLRSDYGDLKRRLAVEFADDRAGYNDAKFDFVFSAITALDEQRQSEGNLSE